MRIIVWRIIILQIIITPHLIHSEKLLLSFVCQSCKWIKDKDTFRLKFYFWGLQLFCAVERFPEPVEIVAVNQIHCLKDIMESSESTTCRWHKTLPSSGLYKHMHSLLAAKRKRCIHPSRGVKSFWERVSLWHQESHLFSNVQILLPVRDLLGNCYFCIYLFDFLYVIVFYLFLFNSYR